MYEDGIKVVTFPNGNKGVITKEKGKWAKVIYIDEEAAKIIHTLLVQIRATRKALRRGNVEQAKKEIGL